MKKTEELKQDQYLLKARLHELVEFMNSTEFFTLNESRKKMYNNLKIAIEIHLRCLSTMVYENLDNPVVSIPDFSLIGTMLGMFTPSYNLPKIEQEKSNFETKEKADE